MKKLFVLLSLFTSAALYAQTTTPQALPGFTNLLGPFLTNRIGGNLVAGDLSPLLANLENSLLQILPALTAFNNSFDLVPAGGVGGTNSLTNGAGAVGAATTTTSSSNGGNNFSSLASTSLASAQGTSLGQDLSSILGGTGTAIAPDSPALTPTTGANASTTTTTGPNGVTIPGGFAGLFGTNTFGFTNTRDALRALLVLQADVERMLPIVDALNGANLTIITNRNLTTPALTRGTTTTSGQLSPTGR